MSKWTTAHMPDQSGRIAIVTGANSGLGYETTYALAEKGAHVIMACRSMDRAHQAAASIQNDLPNATLTVMALDLGDLSSVQTFAQDFTASYERLDLLINNAGVMALPRRETVDGFEMQFGINHLGHFALTGHLIGHLMGTQGARVVTVSSGYHHRGEMNFDDIQMRANYDKWTSYARTKLANLLFAFELQRRLDAAGSHVLSVGAHPGYAATNLQTAGPEMEGSALRTAMMKVANALFAQDQAMGALPTLYAAVAEEVNGCDYIGPSGLMEMRGYPEKVDANAKAHNRADAQRLWSLSEQLTGVVYLHAEELVPA